jgi:PKD repeat protein
MKKLLLIFFLFPIFSFSQDDCGTIPTQQQIDYLNQTRNARKNWNQSRSPLLIPIQNHVVRETDSTGGLTIVDISFVMNILNTYYINSNIQFYECDSINYINNSNYYDFDGNDESVFCGQNDIQNVVNIYYFNSVISSSGVGVCGYAYFPPGPDRVIMNSSCALNGSTIVHEIGHYLSLYHTHGPTNNGTTTELVNGSNCSSAGDELCDTPADPNLAGLVTTCQYTGTAVDANGQSYVPDPTNIMSYSQKICRTFLSAGQYNRANYSAINDRGYLSCPILAPPLASFSILNLSSCSGDISFNDESLYNPNYWNWNFGDGTYSNLQNPSHTYLNNGTYDVSLFVSNGLGQDSIFQSGIVTVNLMSPPIAYNDTSYVSPAIFTLSSATNDVNWYTDTLVILPIASGSSFITPLLSNTTTYYVREFADTSVYGGPLDNTIGSGGYYNNDRHLFLDCYTPSTLISTDVYAGTAQAITFELRDNNSQVLADTTITVQVGLNILYLDFDVPVMNNLELGMNTGNSDLYRNSTGSLYPYTIGNIASITGHNSPNSVPYHYFFYNLRMKENCISDFAEATAVFMFPSLVEYVDNSKQLIKTVDILGRNAKDTKSEVLFYIYDDGTVEKKIIFE